MKKQELVNIIEDWAKRLEDVLKWQEYIKTFDNPPEDIDQRILETKESIECLKNFKFIDVLELVKDKLQVYEQDGLFWIQINPMTRITKEQYDLVKEWLKDETNNNSSK